MPAPRSQWSNAAGAASTAYPGSLTARDRSEAQERGHFGVTHGPSSFYPHLRAERGRGRGDLGRGERDRRRRGAGARRTRWTRARAPSLAAGLSGAGASRSGRRSSALGPTQVARQVSPLPAALLAGPEHATRKAADLEIRVPLSQPPQTRLGESSREFEGRMGAVQSHVVVVVNKPTINMGEGTMRVPGCEQAQRPPRRAP